VFSFGSLFAGIGGLDLGLERAGMTCQWQVEIDDYCNKVLEKHWPNVRRYTDVKECGKHNLATVDLICGGFPCQPVSTAGKRQGDKDERWLWDDFARIIRELRPRWVLAENVPGLYSADNGRLFGKVLADLATCGYDAEWDCIPAAAVGAPHRRYRVFIVAHTNGKRGVFHHVGAKKEHTNLGTNHETRPLSDWNGLSLERTYAFYRGSPTLPPRLCRVADGIPSRVDRLRCLGNAVVPQVAEWIGRQIVENAAWFA